MENIRSAGGLLLGLLFLFAIVAVPIILLMGLAEISVWALDWIPHVIGWAMFVALLLVLPAIIPATRGFAGVAYSAVALSYLVCLWLYAMAYTYIEWGLVALVVGIMLAGVGVILTGGLAALFAAEWTVLANIGIMCLIMIGANLLSAWLSELAMRRKLKRDERDNPSGVTIIQAQNGGDTT